MAITVAVRHQTTYHYSKAIKLWPQVIRLRPAPHSRTKIRAYSLKISPQPHFLNWMQDPFGNYQARVSFPEKVDHFGIDVEVIADLVAINPFDFFLEDNAEHCPFDYETSLKQQLLPYLEVTDDSILLEELFVDCQKFVGLPTVDFLVGLNQFICDLLSYEIRMEVGVQTPDTTLRRGTGSCRDFAWLLVQLARKFGLAARFVSGYLVQLRADEYDEKVPSGPAQDFTDLHAWAEVFVPGAGWIGLDATSGLFAGEGHIPLACTPHFRDAAPVTGSTEPTEVKFAFNNSVERIKEDPRTTLPYDEGTWTKIVALGSFVDGLLEDQDVRLTMGGEPTFISATDMESGQWNEEADGDDKRTMAFQLATKLAESFAPNGLLHQGQGKWYPGEPIPRWQYSIYWRRDEFPIWTNKALLADPTHPGKQTVEDANAYCLALCARLGVNDDFLLPAYEDEFYYRWEEQNLPDRYDPDLDPDPTIKRKTILAQIDRALEDPVGYVLPLKWNRQHEQWGSGKWEFKRGKLILIPGNSKLGFRLPLDRLPQKQEQLQDHEVPGDHFQGSPPLLQDFSPDKSSSSESQTMVSARTIRTAVCFEIDNGHLHVFLPPFVEGNDFLRFINALEETCTALDHPIIIDGYQPPFHPDLTKLVVTPDPGVIEVNVHPAASWNEIVEIYDVIFAAAETTGLSTNKFMLDGRHTGTQGGNHITLGGVSPAESPILRRPDLLRSMLNFWQNHPSLSYLFSSPFIGATSQAPRVDEGRPDMIYELEVAFQEIDRLENPTFYHVDRIFRNILTDLTGNTHRAEFCIDKLYSPDSMSGRLGILELRGFDMPAHKEMCLVQLLLIRSLVAAFWESPYRTKLVGWGNLLHDKFMLHHFVSRDIHEVVDFVQERGIRFEKKWLEIFLDFRFPHYGSVTVGDVSITLRAGIEPWIVLGEEMSSAGTARYVDSSVERLELKVSGLNQDRYQVLCNQIVVPLLPTDVKGSYVAGIRYKAWNPPSALHPTVGVHTPLVFDIYDTWNERSIGGCTYHVMHPGGRNYDTFPVNSREAEARRTTRFWEFNHSPKSTATAIDQTASNQVRSTDVVVHEGHDLIEVKTIRQNKEYPNTLDLRMM